MKRRSRPFVYFLRPFGAEGPIKIGCSGLPERRLVDLAHWSPVPLELVARLPGDEELERRFHAAFLAYRSHCEWFHASEALTAVIAEIVAGTFDTSTLPPPQRLPSARSRPRTPRQRLRTSYIHKVRWAFRNNGLDAPPWVDAGLDEMADAGEARVVEITARMDTALADPARFGTPLPYPWAQPKHQRFLAKQADNDAPSQARAA